MRSMRISPQGSGSSMAVAMRGTPAIFITQCFAGHVPATTS